MPYIDTYERIAADAASMSLEGDSTRVSSTVYGLGSSSGRALMRLGEITLRGVDSVSRRIRLQRVSQTIRFQSPDTWPIEHVREVLELQRHVYL